MVFYIYRRGAYYGDIKISVCPKQVDAASLHIRLLRKHILAVAYNLQVTGITSIAADTDEQVCRPRYENNSY